MQIHDLFTQLLDFIFPPSDEMLLVRTLAPDTSFFLFQPKNIHGVTALSDFCDPRVRALIHEAKFHGNQKAFMHLSELLLLYLEKNPTSYDNIAPIPLSSRRERTRGYNQVHEVLRMSAKRALLPIEPAFLKRIRDTQPQTDLSKNDRIRNVRDAFKPRYPGRITGRHILVVDDVTTTGATLLAAKDALLPHSPASITLLALAH